MSDDTRAKRLGRGLSALLGEEEAPSPEALRGTRIVAIELLRPSRVQPRKNFTQDDLDSLASSIRQKGVLQPIIVRADRDHPGAYEIVAGERRWRAAQLAQIHEVPVLVKDIDEREMLEIAIIENVQRANLDAIEEANAYTNLMENFGHDVNSVVDVVGKSRSYIANTLRLLQLPARVKEMVVSGVLTAGHARALVGLDNAEELADRISKLQLSVRETELLAKKPHRKSAKKPEAAKDADLRAVEKNLSESLGLRVSVNDRDGKGEVRIAYSSLDQLDEICRRLKRA